MQGPIKGLGGWIKNSFIDFPGAVSTVLFFTGCNLRCPYCHNSRLITVSSNSCVSPSHAKEKVFSFLQKRKKLIDGVVITGGEPTLHPHLISFIEEIRTMGYRIKLDTNGLLPDVIRKLSPDYLAVDIKTDPRLYPSLLLSPYSNNIQRLTQSIDIVKQMKNNAEIRITVAPGLISKDIIETIKHMVHGVSRIFLQKVNLGKDILCPSFFENRNLPTLNELKEYQRKLTWANGMCTIRNE